MAGELLLDSRQPDRGSIFLTAALCPSGFRAGCSKPHTAPRPHSGRLQQTKAHQAFTRGGDGLFARSRRPSEQAPGFPSFVAFLTFCRASGTTLFDARIPQRGRVAPSQLGSWPGRHAAGPRGPKPLLQHGGDLLAPSTRSRRRPARGKSARPWRQDASSHGCAGRRRRGRRPRRTESEGVARACRRPSDAARSESRSSSPVPSTGPKTPTGLTTDSSRAPPFTRR